MGLITTSDLNEILDNLALSYARLDGDGATYGVGNTGDSWGSVDAIVDALAVITGSGDIDVAGDLASGFRKFSTELTADAIGARYYRGVFGTLDRHLLKQGAGNFRSLATALTYLNTATGTKWQALQHPRLGTLYSLVKGSALPRENLYFEVLQSAYANGLRKLVVGTGQTAGTSIADTYAGGTPKILVSGFGGSSDTVTVTGTAYNPATKTTSAGVTWTATVSGDGTVNLAVGTAPADSLIVAVSGIVAGANISAGTIIVEAHRPSGRPAIPY